MSRDMFGGVSVPLSVFRVGIDMIRTVFLAATLAACCVGSAIAAGTTHAQPNSWDGGFKSADTIETRTFDALDLHQIATEDASREAAGRTGSLSCMRS